MEHVNQKASKQHIHLTVVNGSVELLMLLESIFNGHFGTLAPPY